MTRERLRSSRLVRVALDQTKAVVTTLDAHPTATVFGIALSLRLATVVWLADVPLTQDGDATHYLSIARDILAGRAYGESSGDTIRVPFYHIFLAVHLWTFGEALQAITVTQSFIDASTAVMMTWTAQALMPGRRRWLIGLLWATYPPAILNAVVLFPQPLQVFWLVAAFLLLFWGIKRGSTWRCAAAALFWGFSCMTRSGNLFFLPVFAIAPLVCWRLRPVSSTRWAVGASLVMLLTGATSTLWWTARDFTTTYRLEYLLLNSTERAAAAFLLRPIEPIHERVAAHFRQRATPALSVPDQIRQPATLALSVPDQSSTAVHWAWEIQRLPIKLWQTFGAPDGTVQLGCTGPTGSYWTIFRAEFAEHPLRVAATAISRPCLALKSLMYVEHYVLLGFALPGLVLLGRRLPDFSLILLAYANYTMAIIVLGSNYGNGLAAVPRFAFSFMPVPVLLVGLLLVRRLGAKAPGTAAAQRKDGEEGE